MASSGTPYEGIDNDIVPAVYVSNLILILYTNTPGSLSQSTVLADLTQPSGTGASGKTLAGAWSSTNGVITYDDGTPDNPIFENTGGSNWTGDPSGAAILNAAGTRILHFKDFALGPYTMTPGKQLEIDLSSLVAP